MREGASAGEPRHRKQRHLDVGWGDVVAGDENDGG
jgi:hypothetical protein